jgi:hypothetical protein
MAATTTIIALQQPTCMHIDEMPPPTQHPTTELDSTLAQAWITTNHPPCTAHVRELDFVSGERPCAVSAFHPLLLLSAPPFCHSNKPTCHINIIFITITINNNDHVSAGRRRGQELWF